MAPTFGFNIKTLQFRGWKLNVWDVGGQVSLRSYWRNYFDHTDALVFVIDSTDRKRLRECRRELDQLLNEECLRGVTLLVLANKRDLPRALSADDIQRVSARPARTPLQEMSLEEVKQHRWRIFNSSAYTGENLVAAFEWMCTDVAGRITLPD